MLLDALTDGETLAGLLVTHDDALAAWLRDVVPWLSIHPVPGTERGAHVSGDLSLVLLDDACVDPRDAIARWLSAAPVLVLVRERDAARVAQLLEAGADDAMCAPYLVEEVRARVARLVRRDKPRTQPLDAAGGLYDRVRREVIDDHGRRHRLTPSESIVIESLIDAAGAVVSRETLLRRITAQPLEVKSNVVDRHVATLRAKLGDDAQRPRCIATVPRHGYRLSVVGASITAS